MDSKKVVTLIPVTNNFVTDLLDIMVQRNFDGLYLSPGMAPTLRRGYKVIPTPELHEITDKDELNDAMEALGIPLVAEKVQEEYIHASDHFPDIKFLLSVDLPTESHPDFILVHFSHRRHQPLAVE